MKQLFNSFFSNEVIAETLDDSVDFTLGSNQAPLTGIQQKFVKEYYGIDNLATIRQVHGDNIVVVDKINNARKDVLAEADALVTNMPHAALSVRTADCLPVFIFDPVQKAIGLVHAGWKSTQKKITALTVQKMIQLFGSNPKDLKAAFGPAIHACCYEVNEEFAQYFPEEVIQRHDKYFFDNALANINQLTVAGVLGENIFDCGECTVCGKGYFSFRRDGEKAGRMMSVMMLK